MYVCINILIHYRYYIYNTSDRYYIYNASVNCQQYIQYMYIDRVCDNIELRSIYIMSIARIFVLNTFIVLLI